MKVLLKHTAEANMAPTATEDNVALATSHYAIPLVTDDPWTEGTDEDSNINKLAQASFSTGHLKTKEGKADVEQAVASITRSLKFLRTLLNHTFLLLLIQTSTNQSAKDLRRVFDEHAHAQTLLDADLRKPFLAPDIIKHIKDNCLTDNLRKATSIESTFNKSIRPEGMPLLKWLQTFRHPLALHKKAKGASYNYTKNIERSLWKLHFVKQITGAEQTLILTHGLKLFEDPNDPAIGPAKVALYSEYLDGIFDLNTFEFMLEKLEHHFVRYEPDKMVQSYLFQHWHNSEFEGKPNWRANKSQDRHTRQKGSDSHDRNKRKSYDQPKGERQSRRDHFDVDAPSAATSANAQAMIDRALGARAMRPISPTVQTQYANRRARPATTPTQPAG